MPPRNLLRTQLLKAWRTTIDVQYKKQLINSERGLQVYFCSALLDIFRKNQLTENKRRIFVEPRLSVKSEKRRLYPDIVICNTNTKQIIGVIELKYLPKVRPNFEKNIKKDIKTLEWIADHQDKIYISNDRFLGPPECINAYSLVEDAVLCWGGVYRGQGQEQEQFDLRNYTAKLDTRFLGLHAVTSKCQFP